MTVVAESGTSIISDVCLFTRFGTIMFLGIVLLMSAIDDKEIKSVSS